MIPSEFSIPKLTFSGIVDVSATSTIVPSGLFGLTSTFCSTTGILEAGSSNGSFLKLGWNSSTGKEKPSCEGLTAKRSMGLFSLSSNKSTLMSLAS